MISATNRAAAAWARTGDCSHLHSKDNSHGAIHLFAKTIDRPLTAARKTSDGASSIEEVLGIDLAELETFMAVAELGSFSLAAQRMHVTQPSVTGRVQRLEAALGTTLLVRTTRKVETTAAGAALLLQARRALSGLRTLVADFRQQARVARQRVVVAATPMLAALSLPPIMRDYSTRYTDVKVVLRDLRYAEALSALDEGSADLAVLAYEGHDRRFRAQALVSDDMVVVAPANHPLAKFKSVTLEQIAPNPLLVIEQYEPMYLRIAQALEQKGLALAPSMSVGNLNTLLGMLDAGMGATLLTRTMGKRMRTRGHVVVEIADLKLVRNFALVRSSKTQIGTAAESFARFVRQAMNSTARGD